MSDVKLGGVDVKLDALANGGQMEEWVPLRSPTHGVNWLFAQNALDIEIRVDVLAIRWGRQASLLRWTYQDPKVE